MSLVYWLRSAFAPRHTTRRKATCRLALEPLEDRITPSTGGLLDPTFGSGGIVTSSFSTGMNIAYDVLVQPDGKVVAGGWANMGRTLQDFLVVRYNANGTLDTSFGSGGRATTDFGQGNTDEAYAIALQPGTNGKIVAGGFTDITSKTHGITSTSSHFALARYNPNGSLDTSFGSNGTVITDKGAAVYDSAYGMAVQPDGRIILAGLDQTSGSKQLALFRYTANGALDPTFGSGGKLFTGIAIGGIGSNGHPLAVSLQSDGRIVVAGTTPTSDFLLARFNANGTTDTSFGGGTGKVTTDFGGRVDGASGLAIQTDGRIVVAGASWVPGSGNESVALARYNPDGSLDASFGTGGTVIAPFPQPSDQNEQNVGEAIGVAVQTDGRIVVGGRESTETLDGTVLSGTARAIAERFNSDGTVDTGYGPSGTGITEVPLGDVGMVRAVAIQPDGKAVFAGQAQFGTGTGTDVALFRLLASAPQIGSFTANPNPVTAGSSVTLTASNISDGNPGATVTQVAIYLDSNNDGTLEPGTDTLLGYATQTSPGVWTLTSTSAFGLTAGTYKLFAQAEDSDGVFGDPDAFTLSVQ
jgi:uncharacterized delta-60 repeat protein